MQKVDVRKPIKIERTVYWILQTSTAAHFLKGCDRMVVTNLHVESE